jgi:hypothetical protein
LGLFTYLHLRPIVFYPFQSTKLELLFVYFKPWRG